MPAQNTPGFFSQHVPLFDPLAYDAPLCFDARLEPALHADLRNGPNMKIEQDVDSDAVAHSGQPGYGLPSAMRGTVRGLRYDNNETDECSFIWNNVKDYTTAMLYIVPGASILWVNAIHVPPGSPHLLHDGDIIQLYSPSQSLNARFVYRQTAFLGCAGIPLALDVLKTIGSGSSGVVKECRDRSTGERVAIKIIKANEGKKKEFHEGWPREYTILQALWEPDAVKSYTEGAEIGPEELAIVKRRAVWFDKRRKEHYIVYPLARTDLDQLVTTNGRLNERTAKSVAKQLCTALLYIHDNGIVHCDVKPGNVLITGPGITPSPRDDLRVVLADFGCALWKREIPSIPRSMGTRGCKAPECAHIKKCGSAIDMFALGTTIFFALTGRFPYGYKEPKDIIIDARQLSVWPLLESVGVSAAGQDWLARVLLLDPRMRMTAKEALGHAWITGGNLVPEGLASEKNFASGGEIHSDDSELDTDTESDEDEEDVCRECGAKRRREGSETGSETLEGSGQDVNSMEKEMKRARFES
ncbi:kinase-like protein [Peniophora sp. CONT]|nr:kinase-like protein [Peniophora sp. CONT]